MKYPPFPYTSLFRSSTIEELLHVSLEVGSVNTGLAWHSTVPLSPWPPIVGGVLSSTMMFLLTVPLVFPHTSTACQLSLHDALPIYPAVELSLSRTIDELLHVSLEVGSVNTGVAGHSTVPLSPWPPIVGGVLSSIMMS